MVFHSFVRSIASLLSHSVGSGVLHINVLCWIINTIIECVSLSTYHSGIHKETYNRVDLLRHMVGCRTIKYICWDGKSINGVNS